MKNVGNFVRSRDCYSNNVVVLASVREDFASRKHSGWKIHWEKLWTFYDLRMVTLLLEHLLLHLLLQLSRLPNQFNLHSL